ncbi:unnamed protein product [Pleuronectes platessa]|uniref:Uncharacterized protein n=1 Tax=Pleuronectes platessa TaxID=8262 RepID=A0A9N7UHW1_PLEPL|nr:unnamed protein product [Pleuronectes platessa]
MAPTRRGRQKRREESWAADGSFEINPPSTTKSARPRARPLSTSAVAVVPGGRAAVALLANSSHQSQILPASLRTSVPVHSTEHDQNDQFVLRGRTRSCFLVTTQLTGSQEHSLTRALTAAHNSSPVTFREDSDRPLDTAATLLLQPPTHVCENTRPLPLGEEPHPPTPHSP